MLDLHDSSVKAAEALLSKSLNITEERRWTMTLIRVSDIGLAEDGVFWHGVGCWRSKRNLDV
jgi:hypothetical protein